MQSVSANWIAAQAKTVAPKSIMRIKYASASEPTSVTTNITPWSQAFVDIDNSINPFEVYASKYAVLELNAVELSAPETYEAYPSNDPSLKEGFVDSALSQSDCSIALGISIKAKYLTTQTNLKEVTVIFSTLFEDCFSPLFMVIARLGGSIVASKTVSSNTSPIVKVPITAASYDEVDITMAEWSLPSVRPRVQMLFPGETITFNQTDILTFKHSGSFNPLSFALPSSELTFSVDNRSEDWNPDNPSGNYALLAVKNPVQAEYGFVINGQEEYIKCGKFYLAEWDTPQNGISATFTARGIMDFMDVDFDVEALRVDVGAGSLPFNCTFTQLITSAFKQSGLAPAQYNIATTLLSGITVSTDFGKKCNEVAQLACNLAERVLYYDRDGVVQVQPFVIASQVLQAYGISAYVSLKNSSFEMRKAVRKVDVNNGLGEYDSGLTDGEIQTLQNPLADTQTFADAIASWVYDALTNRKTLSGEYRADPRMDVCDKITVETKYATVNCIITEYEYDLVGMVKGKYKGLVV